MDSTHIAERINFKVLFYLVFLMLDDFSGHFRPFGGYSEVGIRFSLKYCFLSIGPSYFFNVDQFHGHFGSVLGYFRVGVWSESYFGVYLYRLLTFVF